MRMMQTKDTMNTEIHRDCCIRYEYCLNLQLHKYFQNEFLDCIQTLET